MGKKNQIGLEMTKAGLLADKLNTLLANYQVFYIGLRGFHWNITGEKFFELHAKFEELYSDVLIKIDEIAERIRALGFTPLHSFTAYLKESSIKEAVNIADARAALQKVVDGFNILLSHERELLTLSESADDEGTNSLMSDYIRQQEKWIWMYTAYLHPN